jgi:uncharacterized protein YidB (DUF937 family)
MMTFNHMTDNAINAYERGDELTQSQLNLCKLHLLEKLKKFPGGKYLADLRHTLQNCRTTDELDKWVKSTRRQNVSSAKLGSKLELEESLLKC